MRQGEPDAGARPVPVKRAAASVTFGALYLRALGPLRLRVSRSALRLVGEHVRHRLPARRRWPHPLGLPGLHAWRACAALPRLRADRLERATRTRTGTRGSSVSGGGQRAALIVRLERTHVD